MSRARRITRVATAVAAALALAASGASSQLLRNLNGYVDVAAVQSDAEGSDQSTLRRLYQLSWTHSVLPYVHLRADVRYSRFDLDLSQTDESWRQDFQPSGEISWRHPVFTFNARATRRKSTTQISASDVTRDDVGLLFQTRPVTWPTLTLRYDDARAFDEEASQRDTRERRIATELIQNVGKQTLAYRYQHRSLRNIISDLESAEDIHQASWSGQLPPLLDGRLVSTGSYRYEHRRRNDEVIGRDGVLSPLPLRRGLYAMDSSPELGELPSLPGLIDGDLDSPTTPPVEIGGVSIDQNIGADLGLPTDVVAIYVNVDKPSGAGVSWRLYISDDNTSWTLAPVAVTSTFNLRSERYEISFASVVARYVKVVNLGSNEILDVRVTEIQVLEELSPTRHARTITNSHLADARLQYAMSDDLDATLDATYQRLPGAGLRARRDDYSYSFTTRYQQTAALAHVVRWQQELQQAGDDEPSFSANSITYSAEVKPRATLSTLASVTARRTFDEGQGQDDIRSALLRVRGNPYSAVTVTAEVTHARTEKLQSDQRFYTSTGRTSASGTMLRWLTIDAGIYLQRTRSEPSADVATRHSYSAGASARLSRTIFLRGTLNTIYDRGHSTIQDYVMSWKLAPRLALSSQIQLNRAQSGSVSNRYAGNLTYALGTRGSLYVSYSRLFQRGDIEDSSNIFQQGVRYAF